MDREFVFEEGRFFRSCHAVTLLPVAGGLLAAWFAGSYESCEDTAIWGAIRGESGWSEPKVLAKFDASPHWNPVLFRLTERHIMLFFKVGFEIPKWKTFVAESHDEGATWSPPREMVPDDLSGGRGPAKNKPLRLANGDILAPGSTECHGRWKAFVDCSKDNGVTWQRSDDICDGSLQIIQPALWESSPGEISMLLRSQNGFAARAESHDHGVTWTPPRLCTLPNNNSGLDVIWLADRKILLVACNPVSQMGKRSPLALIGSGDNGQSWRQLLVLEDENVLAGDCRKLTGGEFSYPAIIRDGDMIWMGYTWHRRKIAMRSLSLATIDALWANASPLATPWLSNNDNSHVRLDLDQSVSLRVQESTFQNNKRIG